MSKAVKKVFKGVKKAVKKVAGFVKKYWKEIVLVAAVVFTAGAALGYVGMGAGGGLVFGSANVATAAGMGVTQGVGAAWSALGNSVLSAFGVKGAGGTGVFGQGNLAGTLSEVAVTGQKMALDAAGKLIPAQTGGLSEVAVTGQKMALDSAGKLVPEVVKDTAAKTGLQKMGAWISEQSLGGMAQAGGLAMQVYGASQKEDEQYTEYADGDIPILEFESLQMPGETAKRQNEEMNYRIQESKQIAATPQQVQQNALLQRGAMQADFQNTAGVPQPQPRPRRTTSLRKETEDQYQPGFRNTRGMA